MKKNKKNNYLAFLLILLCFALLGCNNPSNDIPAPSSTNFLYDEILGVTPDPASDYLPDILNPELDNTIDIKKMQAAFDVLMDEIFVEEVQSDSITLNYTLAHPENYGITDFKPTMGSYTLEEVRKALATSENYLSKLKEFNYHQLTEEQQLTYKILESNLSQDNGFEDYYLYSETMSPTVGIQSQLPVILAEYNFYTADDISKYLDLFPEIYKYFEDLCTFEKEKSKAGLFMSDFAVDDIIKQCKDFIKDKDNNYLLNIFEEKIADFDTLTENEKNALIKRNKEGILNSLIPAYELIISTLTDLKGTGKNEGGLSNLPKGKEYYEYLVASSTGSSKSIEEIDKLLDQTIAKSMTSIIASASTDPDIIEEVENIKYPLTEPKEILDYLKEEITTDFPALDNVNCSIKYVDKSLEDSLSPAFYLTPAIDNFSENNIYINGSDQYDLSTIFTTIAHEGYPGHLYQNVYFMQNNPAPIRALLNFGGYSEGWATYVEMYSYDIAGFSKKLASILKSNMIANLSLYAKIDIGVNYYSWDLEKTTDYLNDFGITNEDDITTIYKSMVEEPSNYMKYTLGYLEFTALRDKAKKALGDNFILKDFHEFLLDIGPAGFELIDQRLDKWIAAQ